MTGGAENQVFKREEQSVRNHSIHSEDLYSYRNQECVVFEDRWIHVCINGTEAGKRPTEDSQMIFEKVPRGSSMKEGESFQTIMLYRELVIHREKKNLDPGLIPYYKHSK